MPPKDIPGLPAATLRAGLEELYATGRLDDEATMLGYRLLDAWAAQEPLTVLRWCQQKNYPFDSSSVMPRIFRKLSEEGRENVEAHFQVLEGRSLRQAALSGIAQAATSDDPASKLALLDSYGSEGRAAGSAWLRELAKTDPAAAAAAAVAHSSLSARSAALEGVILEWSRRDCTTAVTWLNTHLQPGTLYTRLLAAALQSGAEKDPGGTLAQLKALPAGATRTAAIGSVFQKWAEKKPEEALTAALALPSGAEKSAAITAAGIALSGGDLETVTSLLDLLPSRQAQGTIIRETTVRQASKDPASALEWVTGLKTEALRNYGTAIAYQMWSERDPVAAATYAEEHWDSSPGAQAGHHAALSLLARKDFPEALNLLHRLPEGRRSQSAEALLSSTESLLSDSQREDLIRMTK